MVTSTPDPGDNPENGFEPGGDCGSYTGNEPGDDSNGQWTEWLFGGINNLVECVVMPPINFIGNVVNQTLQMVGSIYDLAVDSLAYGQAAIQWTFGRLFPYIGAHFNNFWAALLYYSSNFFGFLFDAVVGLFQFISDVVSGIIDFVKSIIDFILSGFSLVSNLFSMWNDATPQKPPGLPDCANDPLNYDICAVWYILEFTFFAGIGAFIIPALNVYLVLLIILYFLETVVERMQKIWEILRG